LGGFGDEFPTKRFCRRCCGEDRFRADEDKFAQWRRELRALKTLVSRVRKGETFVLTGAARWQYTVEDPSTHTYETEFEHLAKSPRPKKEKQSKKQSKKQSRSKPSLSEELAELARLRETGALTQLEFILAKHKLLDAPSPKKRKRRTTRKKNDEGPPDVPE